MYKTFVFGDAHSNWKSVLALLEQEGIVNGSGQRVDDDTLVISLGDLANCVVESRDEDLKALDLIGHQIDRLILGNHEAPYFGFTYFNGFFRYPEIKEKLNALERHGFIIPALGIGNILISHAGLTQAFNFKTPKDVIEYLDGVGYDAGIYRAVGITRGGGWKSGGILWADWSESKSDNFIQIVGHTANKEGIRSKLGKHDNHYLLPGTVGQWQDIPEEGWSFCIDLGCNSTGFNPSDTLAGVWIDMENNKMKFVIYGEKKVGLFS